METFFNLQERETIVQEIKPLSNLKWYFFFSGQGLGISAIVGIGAIIYFMFTFSDIFFTYNPWIFVGIGILIGFILNFVFSLLRYGKQYYWITNKRIVYKRGLIGYRITSIPHERISDIIISRTLLEKILGFGSLHIQSLAGQMTDKYTLGAEGVLLAIPNPEQTQELIFKLVKAKRKEEGISF